MLMKASPIMAEIGLWALLCGKCDMHLSGKAANNELCSQDRGLMHFVFYVPNMILTL